MKIEKQNERGVGQDVAPKFDQQSAELAEALRVQTMTPAERSDWLVSVWGKVQGSAQAFSVHAPDRVHTARSYASMDEKNRFDQARELEFAMLHSVYAAQKLLSQA